MGAGRDITRQRQMEEALRESKARFRELFEASPEVVLLIDAQDPRWPILDCNLAACEMSGNAREELVGQSIDILDSVPGDLGERMTYLERLQREGILHYETFHRWKDGVLFPVEVAVRLISLPVKSLCWGLTVTSPNVNASRNHYAGSASTIFRRACTTERFSEKN